MPKYSDKPCARCSKMMLHAYCSQRYCKACAPLVRSKRAMSEIAREFDMGKNPVSKTNLLKTLQTVITAMLGEQYKATSHDVNFLMSVYSKKNRKALTVTCSNHRYFRNYLAEVCHRIVTGKSYELDYRTKKDN